METQINGIAASDGVGIAPAYLLTKPNLSFEKYHISDPDSEKARLHYAFEKIIQKLKETKKKLVNKLNAEKCLKKGFLYSLAMDAYFVFVVRCGSYF